MTPTNRATTSVTLPSARSRLHRGAAIIATALALLVSGFSNPAHAQSDGFRPLYFDIGARGSEAPDGTLMIEPAFEFGRSFASHLAFNIGLTGGSAPVLSGKRSAFTVAPSVDLFHALGPVAGYVRAGFGVQTRSGAHLDRVNALALFTAVGARFNTHLCMFRVSGQRRRGCMILSTEVRVNRALLGGWLMSPAVLPAGTSIVSTSFAFGWEV